MIAAESTVCVTGERMNLPFCMVMEYDDAMFICLY